MAARTGGTGTLPFRTRQSLMSSRIVSCTLVSRNTLSDRVATDGALSNTSADTMKNTTDGGKTLSGGGGGIAGVSDGGIITGDLRRDSPFNLSARP